MSGFAGGTERETQSAKKLYNAKCAKCHKFYDPANYNDVEWESWMKKMGKKAKLKSAQYDLLVRYLDTFRKKDSAKMPAP